MATDATSADLGERLTEFDAALENIVQLVAELPGLAEQIREGFLVGDNRGAFVTPDDSFLVLARARREFPDKAEAMVLKLSDVAVELHRALSIHNAIGDTGGQGRGVTTVRDAEGAAG
jgi:hypothetical protein